MKFPLACGAIGRVCADEVLQAPANRWLDVWFAFVAQRKAQNCDRNGAGVAVAGDQRIDGFQLYIERSTSLSLSLTWPIGIVRFEDARPETRQAVVGDGGAARAYVICRRDNAFQSSCRGIAINCSGVEAKEGLLQIEAFGWPIHNLPIVQIAAPAERDDCRFDQHAAKWQPNLSQLILTVTDNRCQNPTHLNVSFCLTYSYSV